MDGIGFFGWAWDGVRMALDTGRYGEIVFFSFLLGND
jgi:hypothetical protein